MASCSLATVSYPPASAYYNIKVGSVRFQLGAQKKDIIPVFLQDKALRDFRAANGWQAGVDGSVVLVNTGAPWILSPAS